MLQVKFDVENREDKIAFFAIYSALCLGGAGQARATDVQEREASILRKVKALGAPDPRVDLDAMPFDAVVPYVLTTSGALLLEERERSLLVAYIKDMRWSAHLSQMRLDAVARLENAEKVVEQKTVLHAVGGD